MTSEQRYFENNLEPTPLDNENLANVLAKLQAAIHAAVRHIQDDKARNSSDGHHDSLYGGSAGLAFMYLRLAVQSEAAALSPELLSCFPAYIRSHLPKPIAYTPRPIRLSPLDSPIGPAIVSAFCTFVYPSQDATGSSGNWLSIISRAVVVASGNHHSAVNEILYGRAGLLWAMLNLKIWVDGGMAGEAVAQELSGIVGEQAIANVVSEIVTAGEADAASYRKDYSDDGLPLMWTWHDRYYLGAIHGVAGILTILIQCPRTIIAPHLSAIVSTTASLLVLATTHGGHLPSSLPQAAQSRPHALVQICHGSPGLLLLLAALRARYPAACPPEWTASQETLSHAVWAEGLLQKGIGICHGVAGNAWPWLLLAHAEVGTPAADTALARALAFLLHATELPPLRTPAPLPYRTPNRPCSLFEGLAGAVCGWADACTLIRERLGESQSGVKAGPVLGMPGLGGLGPKGML